MKKFNISTESEREYLMSKGLDDDLQQCFTIVTDVDPSDLTKNFLQFHPKNLIIQGEPINGLTPVKLNWEFLATEKKTHAWLVPVFDTISPKSELELFQALVYFFDRIHQLLKS